MGRKRGRAEGLIQRANDNLQVLEKWAATCGWAGFLAEDARIRSNTSVCIQVTDPWFEGLSDDAKADAAKKIAALLEKEGVALDIAGYRAARRACASGAAPPSRKPIWKH